MATPAIPDAPPPAPGPDPLPGAEDHALLDGIQRDRLSLVGHMTSSISPEPSKPLGTIFRVVLPSLAASDRLTLDTKPRNGATRLETLVQPPPGSGPDAERDVAQLRRVLLVDDEVGIRRSVGRFLRRYGYQVTDVPNAQAAVNALGSGRYDAVVSDLRMPGLSGEEFFDLLRRDFPEVACRVVFTSGDILREDTQAFLARSGCPSLQKPYELSELLKVLAGLCPPLAVPDRRATA